MAATTRRLLVAWESIQVELQGRYSIDRLLALARYEQETSMLRALAVILLTPVSCLVMLTLADLIPLKSAYIGLPAQGAVYWIRTQYNSFIICLMALVQFSHSTPGLPLPLTTASVAAVLMGIGTCAIILGMHVWIGFPTPFVCCLQSFGAVPIFGTAIYLLWGSKLRSSADARREFVHYMMGFWQSQVAMLFIYPAMIYVFRTLSSKHQTLFSMALPAIKLLIKNGASYGLGYISDYAPVCISFTVDVFHTLFLACAMQSSTNGGTFVVVMAVDLFQGLVAGYELHSTMARLERLGLKMDALEAAAQATSEHSIEGTRYQSSLLSPLSRSVHILASNDVIRDFERTSSRSHLRTLSNRDSIRLQSAQALNNHATTREEDDPTRRLMRPRLCGKPKIVAQSPRMTRPVNRQVLPHPSGTSGVTAASTLSPVDEIRLCFVRETSQLLFMAEFYLLIELVEVIVPTVYSIYLGAMFYLPNRSNYAHLKTLTDAQYLDTLLHVVKYAALELLSLVLLAVVMRLLVRISPLHHLAFTLQTTWRLAQALLTLWVFFPIQLSLDHIGNDYTMKFEWLHKSN